MRHGATSEARAKPPKPARRRQAPAPPRRSSPPVPEFDESLPIVHHRREIGAAIRAHPVVIVCGETGSGKSTQLPKICLDIGRGINGFIGHTQPRRIAARSVAARIAEELQVQLGEEVGYKIRFSDQVRDTSFIKVLTDGMLLAEIQHDRLLRQYDTLIVDEAHERSLNIDFLLGYLHRLRARRRDLKLIITSATIDTERFAARFDDAPVIEVSGRGYPVSVRYRPLPADSGDRVERDMEVGILRAAEELMREGPGDILVFLPGERDIRNTAQLLRKRKLPHTEILPLYARLSAAEQQRVFHAHRGRRIVLATNVAETSLTVPGIRYVIDPGLARVSRYRPGRQVQGLPIEPISQASANQRKGRCGRVAEGICIRLYAEEDFHSRPEFTDPEILRTPLSAVILNMAQLGLGKLEAFPFLDPPSPGAVKDGYRQLEELGAMNPERRLTPLGRRLARLPVDPRIGRMLLEAERHHCLEELLTIGAALSIADPREYPAEHLEAARAAHARDTVANSDFLTLLQVWSDYRRESAALNARQRRRYCRDRFLSYVRMREWADIRAQLRHVSQQLGLPLNPQPAKADAVHRAILAGLLGHIACRTEFQHYLATRDRKLFIHPSSATVKRPPKWIMAAELVETARLYARTVAQIDPAWVEPLAGALLRRRYLEPRWDEDRQCAVAWEQVTLYGLVIVNRRRVDFGPIDTAQARDIFIREGLVGGKVATAGRFLRHNQELIAQIEELEHRSRRHDILVDDPVRHAFYDARLPAEVCDAVRFERWRQQAEQSRPELLFMSRSDLMRHAGSSVTVDRFPESMHVAGNRLRLGYRFQPGHPDDGVTVYVPLPLMKQLPAEPFSWLVPGLLIEKIIALIRSLPKPLRRHFAPAAEHAERALAGLEIGAGSLEQALATQLTRDRSVTIQPRDWDPDKLPAHLKMNFAALDGEARVVASGRDLALLKHQLRHLPKQAEGPAVSPPPWEREGLTRWDFEDLPVARDTQRADITLTVFPALVDEGDSVSIRTFDTPDSAAEAHAGGVMRLARITLRRQYKDVAARLPHLQRMCLDFAAVAPCARLKEDLLNAVTRDCFVDDPHTVRERDAFDINLQAVRRALVGASNELCEQIAEVLRSFRVLARSLDALPASLAAELREQLALLVYPGFVSNTPRPARSHLLRYLKAATIRVERAQQDPGKDRTKAKTVEAHWQRLLIFKHRLQQPLPPTLAEFRWLVEELRVSVFAQELGTGARVSPKRLEEVWLAVKRELLE